MITLGVISSPASSVCVIAEITSDLVVVRPSKSLQMNGIREEVNPSEPVTLVGLGRDGAVA
jgi:hypothetical protein